MAEDASLKAGSPPREVVRAQDVVAPAPRKQKSRPAAKAVPDVTSLAEDEKNKVVHIVRRLQEDANKKLARKRIRWPLVAAAACILLPTFLASLYYIFIAPDQYVSEARFAVRSSEAQAADVLGMVTGMPSSTVVSDSYIVTDYVGSREMVRQLEQRLPIREIYSNPAADFLTRLDPDANLERVVKYWNRRIDVFYDSTKNTITLQVQAFTPQDAERIAAESVTIVRTLLNELSAQARRDAVQFASGEVARAELRVRGARDDVLQYRLANNEFDPSATATTTLEIVATLEAELSQLSSQVTALSGYMSEDAPSLRILRSRIAALEAEKARIQGSISQNENAGKPLEADGSQPKSSALASEVAAYQELLLNQEFAETAYTAALGSLERARAEADRVQSYLAMYVSPSLAQDATYPRRVLNIFLVLLVSAIAWAIGSFAVMTVRDHMP